EDVPCVAAINDALRNVDAATGDVGAVIDIGDCANRTAMNTHSHSKIGATFQRFANLQGTLHGSVRRRRKNQSHAVAGWNASELSGCFRGSKRFGAAYNLV